MKQLFDMAGGIPRFKNYQVTANNTWETMISAVTGKIIVPAWCFIYAADDSDLAVTHTISLRHADPAPADGTLNFYRVAEIDTEGHNYNFIKLGYALVDERCKNAGIEIKSNFTGAVNAYICFCLMGYYLVDSTL